MPSLLDSITGLITPGTINQVASKLGESDASISRGLNTGLAGVLAGLAGRTNDTGLMRQVFELASSRDNNLGVTTDPSSLIRGLTSGAMMTGVGGSLLSSLFGGRTQDVGEVISRNAGLSKASSGGQILAFVAPLIVGFLGRRIRDGGLSLSGLTSMLAGERDSIRAAAPAALLDVVDPVPAARRTEWPETRERTPVQPPERSNRWLAPLLGGLAALALLWLLLGRTRTPGVADTALATTRAGIDTALAAGRRFVDTAAGVVGTTARDLGSIVSRTIPGGVILNIPERGIESKLVAFIEDTSRPVNDTTWFEFDRLNFATGEATILPESQEQINNISQVLKAYPNVKVKVGGYTDNTGDAAANQRLSQARADAVSQALIATGIAASRLTAEGYGSQHAIADNVTEEGRARNRRIALRVTEK